MSPPYICVAYTRSKHAMVPAHQGLQLGPFTCELEVRVEVVDLKSWSEQLSDHFPPHVACSA